MKYRLLEHDTRFALETMLSISLIPRLLLEALAAVIDKWHSPFSRFEAGVRRLACPGCAGNQRVFSSQPVLGVPCLPDQ